MYERENGEGGREADDWATGVRELGMIGRGVVGSRLGLEGGVDAKDEKEPGTAVESVLEDASTDKPKLHTATAPQALLMLVIRITVPDSDIPSTILPSYDAENGLPREDCYGNSLDQQRRQRVRFDEALRMHSYGGSQYVGRVVDRDV